ncbi:MAG: AmmeMemoRadiSam system protein B [Desulfohalobiaceae bacterium]
MNREPVVAGQFYPGSAAKLRSMVEEFLAQGRPQAESRTLLAMVPHAGYVFSGGVAGQTLQRANLPRTLILLGPNHTGQGKPYAVWPEGAWRFPGAELEVDAQLAQALLKGCPEMAEDTSAHRMEHSLEVVLPFLHALDQGTRIVPICVSGRTLGSIKKVGQDVARVVEQWPDPVSLVVSSDMSHYVTQEQARERDALAIQAVLDLDPDALYEVVRRQNITMCGMLPMTLGLTAAVELGAETAELVSYTTSAEASGDYSQVVGYAGMVVS